MGYRGLLMNMMEKMRLASCKKTFMRSKKNNRALMNSWEMAISLYSHENSHTGVHIMIL